MDKLYSKFLDGSRHIISLVGAGGKSTVMYEMAGHLAAAGKRVLVSTTTHIFKPDIRYYAADAKAVHELWHQGSYAVIGTEDTDDKLTGSEKLLQQLDADIVILEADGAKRFPCKVPAAHEPVLLAESDIVIGVFGMDALGKKLRDCCFRLQEAQQLLQVDTGHILNERDAADILLSEQGTRKKVGSRKYYIVLNKCDSYELYLKAQKIKSLLAEKGMPADDIWLRGAEGSE